MLLSVVSNIGWLLVGKVLMKSVSSSVSSIEGLWVLTTAQLEPVEMQGLDFPGLPEINVEAAEDVG